MGAFCLDYIQFINLSDYPYPELFFEPFAYPCRVLKRVPDCIPCWWFKDSSGVKEPDNCTQYGCQKYPYKPPPDEVQESSAIYRDLSLFYCY